MPYTLHFSDPGNLKTITVPDYPPGLNAVDTSLSFIGKAYPNYGQVLDENLLKLLENFAGPLQPNSPIKGQLWYDSFSRSLKLFDGNAWKSANGIYQQDTDPAVVSPVSYGDIWVDTANTILKIRGVGNWIQVGPSESDGTGISVVTLDDVTTSTQHTVLFLKVNGSVLAVFNNDDAFTPATYPSELSQQDFNIIAKGITLPTTSPDNYIIQGTADNANKLNDISGTSYLRKDDTSAGGQLVTGKVVFVTPASSGQENRDGIIIRTSGENPSLNFIQFFKKNNDAVISNEVKGGKVLVKVKGINDTNQTDVLEIEKNEITVRGDLQVPTGMVFASILKGTLSVGPQPNITSVGTLTSLSVSSTISATGEIHSGNITSTGTVRANFLYASGAVIEGIYSTGTTQLWAGSTSTGVPNGWLVCDGSQQTKSAYPGLYEFLGDRYGPITSTTFYLPNLVLTSPLPTSGTTTTYYIIKQD